MKKHLTPLEQLNCNRNCTDCWESDCFGNCLKKCKNCEFDGSEDCYFGQWCKYWDGHGIPEVSEEEYGCLSCTACKTESAPEIDAKDFESFEKVIQGLEMPF